MTLCLVMLHNHTRFGNKMFCGQKISSGQTFTNILNLHCDLDLERSISIFPQDTPAYNAVLSKQVWLQTVKLFRRYSEKIDIF